MQVLHLLVQNACINDKHLIVPFSKVNLMALYVLLIHSFPHSIIHSFILLDTHIDYQICSRYFTR